MEVRAVGKYIRVQPRKVRIIADLVRGKNANYSSAQLRFHTSKSAQALNKVLQSAMANAQENHGMQADTLRISEVKVDQGPSLKRIRARAQGRANRILKKTSHITVVVNDDHNGLVEVKPHGTKAKARPSFGKPKKAAKPTAKKDETAPVEAVETPVEVVEATPVPEEATPVTASEAPEEAGSAGPVAEQSEDETSKEETN